MLSKALTARVRSVDLINFGRVDVLCVDFRRDLPTQWSESTTSRVMKLNMQLSFESLNEMECELALMYKIS
ncbi:hypothetical protein CKO18_15720 [Rhodoferax fermentans]|uniref:Uncharacterized protein n=1 Tax=Rhodoferax fermentans TaxID=28066 RepID=A0A1T1ATL9_RHOFE|nr:hypothetical protein [Rhodoferax fermentans]MBK1685007.1 hypothetical protein [Rhodoferax fermentans]OOV07431.1 hypothetical protein RF819_12460 [Rhodoferax fermentans]